MLLCVHFVENIHKSSEIKLNASCKDNDSSMAMKIVVRFHRGHRWVPLQLSNFVSRNILGKLGTFILREEVSRSLYAVSFLFITFVQKEKPLGAVTKFVFFIVLISIVMMIVFINQKKFTFTC